MYHIANDKREYRSAEKLVAAAQRILLDTDPQKLTVSLLSREAGVSRTTFYRLFDEPEDVLRFGVDQRFHDVVRGYVDLIDRAVLHGLSVPNPLHWYEEVIRKNEDDLRAVLRSGNGELVREAHKKALREFAPVLFPDLEPDSEEFTFFVELRAGIILSGLTAWVETGGSATFEDFRRYAARQLKLFSEE